MKGSLFQLPDNDSLVYIIYTSGSTGRPKGAMNIHKGIVNYLAYMKRKFQSGRADRIIQLTSFSFDISVFELFGTLSYGGSVVLMDDTQIRDPDFINPAVIKHQGHFHQLCAHDAKSAVRVPDYRWARRKTICV